MANRELEDKILYWASEIQKSNISFKEGIYPSEMAAFLGLCDFANVNAIVESGRGQFAYSTQVLRMYSRKKGIPIASIDFSPIEKLQLSQPKEALEPVRCFSGNSFVVFPQIVKKLNGPIALLVDGPKLLQANLFSSAVARLCDLRVVAHHNCSLSDPAGKDFFERFRNPFYYEDLDFDQVQAWHVFKKWEFKLTQDVHSHRSFDHSSLAMAFSSDRAGAGSVLEKRAASFQESLLHVFWVIIRMFSGS